MAIKLSKAEYKQLTDLVANYENACSELLEALTDIHSEWEMEFADRSEKWQEGEAGQEAQERINTVQGWIDEIPESVIDLDSLLWKEGQC